MNIGRAITDAMREQRDADHDRVAYSDLYCFERDVVDGVERMRKVRLTIEEAMATA